ncbi:MAG: MFS transporter [Jatrophihabitans sp.]|uniref:MFS transporter n=1 Tax=Jatrophihabitans sp. TaxID=1932789 RepID=UPI003F8015B2
MAAADRTTAPGLSPWRFVLVFGVVSLLADMVYEGARSIIGPYLTTLGASATVVGAAAGAGEFIGYGLRVMSGYAVSRTRHYWRWTILGYALTAVSVPLIGATGALVPALLLYGGERLGKAVRSPAKDTLLSFAAARTGRGTGFGVHQALDQTGAVLGPLVLAGVLAWRTDDYRLAFGVLAVPGVAVLVLLGWLRRRVPDPRSFEDEEVETPRPDTAGHPESRRLPRLFWQYAALVGLLSVGIVSFPLLAFHAVTHHVLTAAHVPLLFAAAMAVDGASGPVVGRLYDRCGPFVLLAVPVAAALAALALTTSAALVWLGVGAWAVVSGVLDSTAKAVVTELVPSAGRAVAFGWFALVRGAGLLAAGIVLGAVYDADRHWAIAVIVALNAVAAAGLAALLGRVRRAA